MFTILKPLTRLQKLLFYLLLLLLPTQFGRHFFFDFSFIQGIRSDYLAPTVYLTDIIVFFLIFSALRFSVMPNLFRHPFKTLKSKILNQVQDLVQGDKKLLILPFFFLCYLLFNTFLIASNKWIALYKLLKIVEFVWLGVVIVKIKPRISSVVCVLSVGVFYSSVIAIWQFILQRSVGGLFYFLGERTFYAATPSIALMAVTGKLFLRPYGTFPHPNVLAGFLAVVLPILLFLMIKNNDQSRFTRFFHIFTLAIGTAALFLAGSRTGWLVGISGFILSFIFQDKKSILVLVRNKIPVLAGFYSLIVISIGVSFFIPLSGFGDKSVQERQALNQAAVSIFAQKPLFGWGLNNSVLELYKLLPKVSDVYIFQPVHNLYLLMMVELGVAGFFLFSLFFSSAFFQSLVSGSVVLVWAISALFFLGLSDHYLFTLQQGQLLLTLFASLAFVRYNKKRL